MSNTSILNEFNFYTFGELTEADKKPPEFIIENMIPVGMSFLAGAPKMRKSFMALQMALSVAKGEPFLGRKTIKCDVAYLDLEGSKSRFSNRVERMAENIPSNIFITNSVNAKLTGQGSKSLVEKIRLLHEARPNIRFVIIDTYSRSKGRLATGGMNAYDVDVELLEPVQRMALENNIALLFVHHFKKMGSAGMADTFEQLSGTMGISGSCDSVLCLNADGNRADKKATLEYTPRDAQGGSVNLIFDNHSCQWEECETEIVDLQGNPITAFCLKNAPSKGHDGRFFSYDDVWRDSYRVNTTTEKSANVIRNMILKYQNSMVTEYGVAVQVGARNANARGIRVFSLR